MYPHYSPITKDHHTNLLPIVYPAFHELNFAEEQTKEIVNRYVAENEIKDLNSVYFIANDFETHYLRKLELFFEMAKSNPIEDVIVNYLKDKKRSMASASFWGIVRIATAIREGDDQRVIHALAYYDCIVKDIKITGQDVTVENAKRTFISLMQKRRHFRGLSLAESERDKIRIIIQNQDSLLNITGFQSVDVLELVILETITEWYLMTEDDYVRQVLIGFHALIVLKDLIPEYEGWLCEFWLQAQVFSIMTKRSLLWKKVDLLLWDELYSRIKECEDLNKIKLFYVVSDLAKTFRLDNLRKIAQTIVT